MAIMLRKVYFKELKDAFRDQRTLLLTVLIPIIMMTGLVLFYEFTFFSSSEGEEYDLAISEGIGDEERTVFQEHENINLIEFADPVDAVIEGEAQAAVIFEANFFDKLDTHETTEVTIYGDTFSRNSSNLIQEVTLALATFERAVVLERLLAEGIDHEIIVPFTIEQSEISEESMPLNLLAMLVPLMLILAIGIGASPSASDLFAGEKERKTMEALLMTPVKRSTLLIGKWLAITTIGAVIGIITLLVVLLEIQFFTEHLLSAFQETENMFLIFAMIALIAIAYAVFSAAILMLTSIAAKTVKESQSYSTPVMMIAIVPAMLSQTMGVHEFNLFHFSVPILNFFTINKELLLGIINIEHILIVIGTNLLAGIILFAICRMMFMKDKWVMD